MLIDARLLELEEELARRQQETVLNPMEEMGAPVNEGYDARLAELEEELSQRQTSEVAHSEPEEQGFNWSRFLGEQMARGGLSLADLLQHVVPNIPMMTAQEMGLGNHATVENPVELIPETVEPETGLQRIAGRAAQAVPAALLTGPSGLLRNAIMAGATGATSGTLEEAGLPPLAADIAAIVGVPGAGVAARKLFSKGVTGKEQKIGEYLQRNIGQESIPEVSQRLKNLPSYGKSGYQPMTAEIAETPTFSQLHRLQYEIPGSGLPQHAGRQNKALSDVLEEATLNADYGRNLEKPLSKKLGELKDIRRKETSHLYEEIENMTDPLNPKHTKKFLKETVAKGDVEKDLNYVKKLIKPSHKLTPEELAYKKYYGGIKSKDILSQLEKPKSQYPSVNELTKAREALNSRLEKRVRSGENQRALMLKRAKNALDEDLERIPLHKEATQKYKELSKPISHIREHPSLKGILNERKLKKRLTNHMGKLFDESSADNVAALKNAIGEDSKTWGNIREASIEHLVKSVSNAGAEGSGHIMSYPKMRRFMERHHDALGELLDTDQMELLGEMRGILRGQNIAKTLGKGEGSPTHARLRTDLGLKESTGMKAAELAAATQPGLVRKGLGVFLNNWGKNHQEQMMDVFNKALLEPEYAHKLINLKPRNQLEFNKFVNHSLRRTPVLATHPNSKEKHE